MGLKKQLLVVGLGAALALTGCNPPANQGGTTTTTTGGATTTGAATTTGGGGTATPDAPEQTATPDGTATPSGTATPTESGTPAAAGPEIDHTLNPLPGQESTAPKITKKQTVSFKTTAGEVVMEIYPEAAPNAAARFVELVESGFYDDTPISRVVSGFVAQFGVNWRDPHKAYKEKLFDDDPSIFSLDRGTLAFAKAGPNTNSTQVFINFKENNNLVGMGFTTFGKVVEGMDVVDSFAVVGDPQGGLDQMRLWDAGGEYIESLDKKPTMIEKATVVK